MKFPLFVALLAFCSSSFADDAPHAQPPGEAPEDTRLQPLKELDGYFPFTPPETREAWAKRADELRMQIRVALGLWPEPTKTPLNAVVHGRSEGQDYTVEKVYFESMPGFFVTGSLFRPRTPGPHPAVLCPHGHWTDARFAIRGDAEMKKELETGGEFLPESGRSMFQSLGVQFARMGIVAFVIDMLGYCDSQQISFEIAHKFAKQRSEMNTGENWGLFSPQAEAHAQSVLGLQTWNNIRALDFLTTLPDVDATRLGCTGASGGGTQTMMLAALDPRLTVVCPAVMVSTAMQGGCTCENSSLLRIGTGNVEIAALFAPKPMGMTAANDWTKEMETKGFPELKKLYTLLGAPQNVALWPHLQFGHNYNAVSRAHIYGWFNEHFHLGLSEDRLVERDYPLLTREQLTVWDDQHPAPSGGPDFERKLLKWWNDDAQAQMAKSPEEFARIAAPAWKTIVGKTDDLKMFFPGGCTIPIRGNGKTYPLNFPMSQAQDENRFLGGASVTLWPQEKWNGNTVLWIDERGTSGLFTKNYSLRPEICRLLEAGWQVEGVNLFGQFGPPSFTPPLNEITGQTPRSKNPREAAAYTFGYNRAFFAERAGDTRQAMAWLKSPGNFGWAIPKRRYLAALDSTGPIAAAALATLSDKIDGAVINTSEFRFGNVYNLQSPDFQPAAAKYGDLPGLLNLAKEHADQILILGEGDKPQDPIGWLIEHGK